MLRIRDPLFGTASDPRPTKGYAGGCKSSIYYLIRASARVMLVLDVFQLDRYLPELLRTEVIEGAPIDNTLFC